MNRENIVLIQNIGFFFRDSELNAKSWKLHALTAVNNWFKALVEGVCIDLMDWM